MNRVAQQLLMRLLTLIAAVGLAAGCATTIAQDQQGRFDRAALDSMLAPVALYPDPLLSHVLMAATYPEEVEEAARWSRARPGLSGDAAVRTSEGWDWEPSVRSLLAFPQVLDTMANYLRWTEDLGSAFLEQREEVMDTVQALRRRAYAAGTLRSNESVRVVDTGYGIVIEPATPQSVHVPYYDSRQAYGTWWWPAQPPVYWSRWPGYGVAPGGHGLIWGPGTAISSGFFFGGFVWPRREVRVVHVDNYYYRHHHAQRQIERPGLWRHDDSRRREFRESRRRDDQRAPRMTRTPEERREIQAVPAPRNPRTVDRNNRDRGDGVRGDGVRGAPQAPREARDDQGPRVRRPQGGDERAAPRARNDGSGLDRQREERRIERGTPQRGQTRPEQFHRENRGD